MVVLVIAASCKPDHFSGSSTQSVSGWREDFSEPVRRWLLEEIGTSNPSFPTHRIFAQLLRRQAEHLLKATVPGEPRRHTHVLYLFIFYFVLFSL